MKLTKKLIPILTGASIISAAIPLTVSCSSKKCTIEWDAVSDNYVFQHDPIEYTEYLTPKDAGDDYIARASKDYLIYAEDMLWHWFSVATAPDWMGGIPNIVYLKITINDINADEYRTSFDLEYKTLFNEMSVKYHNKYHVVNCPIAPCWVSAEADSYGSPGWLGLRPVDYDYNGDNDALLAVLEEDDQWSLEAENTTYYNTTSYTDYLSFNNEILTKEIEDEEQEVVDDFVDQWIHLTCLDSVYFAHTAQASINISNRDTYQIDGDPVDVIAGDEQSFNDEDFYKIKFKWSDAQALGCTDDLYGWSMGCGKFDRPTNGVQNETQLNDINSDNVTVWVNEREADSDWGVSQDYVYWRGEASLNPDDIITIQFRLQSAEYTPGNIAIGKLLKE